MEVNPPASDSHSELARLDLECGVRRPAETSFFSGAKHFMISGGEFTSITNLVTDAVSKDFCTIQLGNLDLHHEIRLHHESGVVTRVTNCTRKVYAARINGTAADMTAIVYELEEQWREDVMKYHNLRHPNIVQVYGTVSSGGFRATVLHGDLIPIRNFFKLYHDSALTITYLHGYFSVAFLDAATYIRSVSHMRITSGSYTPWIRLSTGGLCIELTPCTAGQDLYPYTISGDACRTPITLLGPDLESSIISSLSLHHYHEICHWSFSRMHEYIVSPGIPVGLGGIVANLAYSGGTELLEIASLPDCPIMDSGWKQQSGSALGELVLSENGWTRIHYYSSHPSQSSKISRTFSIGEETGCSTCCWLSQSNSILRRMDFMCNCSDIILVSSIHYELEITTDACMEGYIFLCPFEHLRTKQSAQFQQPQVPAYWSTDPSGHESNTLDLVTSPGCLSMNFRMEVWGWSWDESVYAGLWKFHKGKGFDPSSRDISVFLKLPLYHLHQS
ncbi:hypothetical protein MSAN_01525700 [Mycena sanguinolenta]|uniref:Protein kinase domain-containing protein n=1 Tax=Mycena sanguinolenta TaxID=230812 RepID=A0A8H6Y718_9AGAR|nr:hypothetical protein MSAN_01525700 [Mycena sanguinolenta]